MEIASSETETLCPLFVRVQSIDIQKLDFKSGAPRNRHVTCIEASNEYLFLGCISGTIYVFSRKDLKFLFIIPFKGGKVCNISSSENEEDVAVGSVRGIISIFRLSQPKSNESQPSTATSSILKHLCTVSHHSQNEITEILWSLNGKFLFVGDNQGIVSQIDVGSFDEPGANIPSKVILKLKCRIIQLCFIFPYLAVSTISGVYLCDIENEIFTRIQVQPKVDLKSTGVCLIHLKIPEKVKTSDPSSVPSSSLYLLVGEVNTGFVHIFDTAGVKIASKLIDMTGISAIRPMKLFDPLAAEAPGEILEPPVRPEYSRVLGKLFVTDDGLIVSSCHDHCLYVIEPTKMQLVLWSEEFKRINNLKIMSNYMFIGSGTQVNVVSLTQFRLYGEQLLKAGLTQVLQRWIQHAIVSLGIHSPADCKINVASNITNESTNYDCECRDDRSKRLFRSLIGKCSVEGDTFSLLVARHLPFNLFEEETPINASFDAKPKIQNVFVRPLKSFIEKIRFPMPIKLSNIQHLQNVKTVQEFEEEISDVFESLARFYEVQILLPVSQTGQNSGPGTLTEILASIKAFYKQTNILMTREDVKTAISEVMSEKVLGQLITDYIKRLKSFRPARFEGWKTTTLPMFFNFTKFANQNYVQEWFSSFDTQCNRVDDSIVADAIILLIPLVSLDLKLEIWKEAKIIGFFSWCASSVFSNLEVSSSYEYLRNSLLSAKQAKRNHSKEIVSRIYRDLLGSDMSRTGQFLHHFISLVHFITKTDLKVGNSIEKTLEVLLAFLPLKHWSDSEIEQRVSESCLDNTILLNMLKQACLSDGKSVHVCNCGFPVFGTPLCGEGYFIPKVQRRLEETILKLLIQNYDSRLRAGTRDLSRNPAGFEFAMRRSLFETFLNEPLLKNSDDLRIELILRTNSCELLRNLRVTTQTIQTLLGKRDEIIEHRRCPACKQSIPQSTRKFLSDDCIGFWIMTGQNNPEKSLRLFQKSNLNVPGKFSIRFYQLALKWMQQTKGRKLSIEERTMANKVSTIDCTSLHL